MMDRTPRRRGNPVLGLIVLVTIIALLALYQWNKTQQSQADVRVEGEKRLCEVRAEQDGLPANCVYDEDSERWVPVGKATP
jgi:hypothetical protein